jgi:hypothetical protein
MAQLDQQVVRWMKKVEKVLVRLVVLGVLTLVILQMALARASDPLNLYMTLAQKIEAPVLTQTEENWEPNLVFSLEGGKGSELKIRVNDQEVGDLANGKLELKVKLGDQLSLDARLLKSQNLKLKVSGVDKGFSYPKLNQTWPLRGSILYLGQVK